MNVGHVREYDLQRRQGMHESEHRTGGDEAAAKDEDHVRYDKKDRGKSQNGREKPLVGQ